MRILPGPTDAYLGPRTRTSTIGVYLVDSLPWVEIGSAVMGDDDALPALCDLIRDGVIREVVREVC